MVVAVFPSYDQPPEHQTRAQIRHLFRALEDAGFQQVALAEALGVKPPAITHQKRRGHLTRRLIAAAMRLTGRSWQELLGPATPEALRDGKDMDAAAEKGGGDASASRITAGASEQAEGADRVGRRRTRRASASYFPLRARANTGPGGSQVRPNDQAGVAEDLVREIAQEHLVIVEVVGDSMAHDPTPVHDDISDGDYAIFDRSLTPQDGEVVCVRLPRSGPDDEEWLVRRVRFLPGERIRLVPHTILPGAGPLELAAGEFEWYGVLVGVHVTAGRNKVRNGLITWVRDRPPMQDAS